LADEVDVLQRRERVVRLRSQGSSYREIADACGVSVETVSADLKIARAQWLAKIARNKAAWMAEVLTDIQTVRSVAWEDYQTSGDPMQESSVETSEKGTKRRRARKQRKRDPRYLSIILDADKLRAAILGLGDKAAQDRVDEVIGKRRPKILVVRDRRQLQDLVDVTKLVELDIREAPMPDQQGDTIDGAVQSPDDV